MISLFWESGVCDSVEPEDRDLPAAPGPPPASARLATPVVVAAASLTGVAAPSCIPSAGIEAPSPRGHPRSVVAVLEAPYSCIRPRDRSDRVCQSKNIMDLTLKLFVQ